MNPATYIARPGFHDNPIPESTLVEAARSNAQFKVLDVAQPDGARQYEVVLSTDPQAKLYLSSGLVVAHNTSKALAKAMFELAPALNGSVYSARLRRYHSLSDWERRTRRHLQQKKQHGRGHGFNKRLLIALTALGIMILALWAGVGRGLAD